jgi:hypothetical protein
MKRNDAAKEKLTNWRLEAGDALKDAATVYILTFLAISHFDRADSTCLNTISCLVSAKLKCYSHFEDKDIDWRIILKQTLDGVGKCSLDLAGL